MKSFSHLASAVLVITCAQFTLAKNTQTKPPLTYSTFKTVDVPNATATYVYGINNKNEVVGTYSGGDCSQISNQAACGFTYANGVFTTVACELENETEFFGINNKGEVVGTYSFFGGVSGFIWEGNESCSPIADPSGAATSEAWDVNDSGNIVGFYTDTAGNFDGFLYNNAKSTYTTIDCPGTVSTRAYGIRNDGVIVGDYIATAGGPFNGFAYVSGKCITVDYPGSVWSSAKAINKNTRISGWYTDSANAFHGFVEQGGVFTTVDVPGASNTLLFHLNDQGYIGGYFTDTLGVHGVVAIP